jgi:hypothetical protein
MRMISQAKLIQFTMSLREFRKISRWERCRLTKKERII